MLTGNTAAVVYTATYNLEGRLGTNRGGSITSTYSHDAMGQRVRKFASNNASTTVIFVYDQQGQLLGEYDRTGAALREYVWLGGEPIAQFTPASGNNPPNVFYIHNDHLGTPRAVLNTAGQLRWRWLAEPFGTTAPETNPQGLGAFAFNLRHPGQYADSETGLFYNWHRDYDPALGRYTQSDPIGLAGGIDTYAYAKNQPTSLIDPLGLAACPSGTWDQEFGDFGFQVAAGGFTQVANINVKCRAKPTLKCKAKQFCIGGGPMVGVGVSWSLGGVVMGTPDSGGLGGWGGWNVAIGSGPIGGQVGVSGDGAQTSVGPNLGLKFGAAAMRCFTYALKCTDDGCRVD